MSVSEILPELRQLSRRDQLHVMQFLVSQLASEETDLLKAGMHYPVWSTYDAFEAADKMLDFLKTSSENHDQE